jgi:hypothetical protein
MKNNKIQINTTPMIDKNTKANLKRMNKMEQEINELNESTSDQA